MAKTNDKTDMLTSDLTGSDDLEKRKRDLDPMRDDDDDREHTLS